MLKKIIVILMLVVCCYCLENNDHLLEESRAKKKKGAVKLLKLFLLLIFSKVAIFKVITFFFFMVFFQKMFSFGGLALTHFLKNHAPSPPPAPVKPPQDTYGSPQEYNTLGYSYGSPEHEPFQSAEAGYPSLSDLGSSFGWLLNKS